MAFKLRSGNKTPFKAMGSTEETNAQYNARVRAEYEARLQERSDSTTSYNMELEKNKVLTRKNQYGEPHYYEHRGLDEDGNPTGRSLKYSDWKKIDDKQKELGIFQDNLLSPDEHKFKYISASWQDDTGRDDYDGEGAVTDASLLKPKGDLRKPTYKIIPTTNLEILPKKTVEPQPKKSKRKYISKGKTKINLQTGEVTKVKTKTVKGGKRKKKRKVKNLVTGKNNRIQ